MSEVNCITRKPYHKGVDKYQAKPFKDASAELKMLLEPLSLFMQQPKESRKSLTEIKSEKYEKTVDNSRHDECHLMECVAKHLQLKQDKDNPYLSVNNQQEFITVLLNQVSHVEPNIKEQINNPSLSLKQKVKVISGLHQCVIRICEMLFQHYCDKAYVMHEKGIFSGTANLCRLRTQLILHAEKVLTIQKVKQIFLSKKNLKVEDSLEKMDDAFKFAALRRSDSIISKEISEIVEQMPTINLAGLLPACLHTFSELHKRSRGSDLSAVTINENSSENSERYESPISYCSIPLRRCHSQPQLSYGETIWDEMEIETPVMKRCLSVGTENVSEFLAELEWEKPDNLKETNLPTKSLISQDLDTLLRNKDDDTDLHTLLLDDMPPLIKAVPRNKRRQKAKEKLDKQIQELYEKEKEYQETNSLKVPESIYDQPAILTTKLGAKTTARTTCVRVSKRMKAVNHHLVGKCPQYNDLLGEIDAETLKDFDRPLFEEKDLAKVFDGFFDSIKHNDIVFDSDTTFLDVPAGLDLNAAFKNREASFQNKELCQFDHPPWYQTSYIHWVKQPSKIITINNENIHPRVPDLDQFTKKESKEIKYWHHWWNNIIKRDDYLKVLSLQNTDFLSTIFHLFDEEKEEKEGKEGKDILSAESITSPLEVKDLTPEETKRPVILVTPAEPKPFNISKYQGRFNKLWDCLQIPMEEKIEMAIKFSTQFNQDKLQMALDDWEQAAQLINQRETIMASLMAFESEASDPNRFFIRGPGNARMRLIEAKSRSTFYKKIEQLDQKISKQANTIKRKYGEVVSFQDRPYLEKMKWDRIEMLHWLQEVRKINALHYESKKLQIKMPDISFKEMLLKLG